MASNNYTQNTTFYGQPTYIPLFGTQNGMQSNMSMAYPSSVEWNSQDSLVDLGTQLFAHEEEDSYTSASISNASKKITKASSESQTSKGSQKRSKRGRNPWTPKEDAKLMELMKKYGQSWAMISSMMDGRSGKQVRDRYLNKLRPGVKLGDWSAQEDELVVTLIKEIGHRWSLIANHLPGRTEGQVKNRFYSHIKKRILPNGAYSQPSVSISCSEGVNSFTASPQGEEVAFDLGQEFDANMFSSACPIPNFVQSKGPYVEDEDLSEESTTQGPASHNSPMRSDAVDPTDVISYDAQESIFGTQFKRVDSTFYIPSNINENHVDEMLTNVTDYFVGNVNKSSDVESYFAEEYRCEDKTSAQQVDANERLVQLNRRKAYLELALAKTLKEMKGF